MTELFHPPQGHASGGESSNHKRPASGFALIEDSAEGLRAAINRFIAETNDDPKPFVWTARPDAILAAVKRGRET